MSDKEYGIDGREVTPECPVCGLPKKPFGRDVGLAAANSYCDWDCDGYARDPLSSSYFPGEVEPLTYKE